MEENAANFRTHQTNKETCNVTRNYEGREQAESICLPGYTNQQQVPRQEHGDKSRIILEPADILTRPLVRHNLILTSHLRVVLLSGAFKQNLPWKFEYGLLASPVRKLQNIGRRQPSTALCNFLQSIPFLTQTERTIFEKITIYNKKILKNTFISTTLRHQYSGREAGRSIKFLPVHLSSLI